MVNLAKLAIEPIPFNDPEDRKFGKMNWDEFTRCANAMLAYNKLKG